jgi:hypothetical protein
MTFLDFLEAYPTPDAARSYSRAGSLLATSPLRAETPADFRGASSPMPTGLGETSYVEMVRDRSSLRYLAAARLPA